jgi:hypothetical protein
VGQGGGYRNVFLFLPIRRQGATRMRRQPPLGMCGSVGLEYKQLWREPGSQQPTAGPLAKSPSWFSQSSAPIEIQESPRRIDNPGSPRRRGRFVFGTGLAAYCRTFRANAEGVGLAPTGVIGRCPRRGERSDPSWGEFQTHQSQPY